MQKKKYHFGHTKKNVTIHFTVWNTVFYFLYVFEVNTPSAMKTAVGGLWKMGFSLRKYYADLIIISSSSIQLHMRVVSGWHHPNLSHTPSVHTHVTSSFPQVGSPHLRELLPSCPQMGKILCFEARTICFPSDLFTCLRSWYCPYLGLGFDF